MILKKIRDYFAMKNMLTTIQKNYAWVIAGLTALGVITSNVLKFIEYLTSKVYFSYYDVDQHLYQYSDKNFIYNLCLSIIFLMAFIFLLYCIKQIKDRFRFNKTFFANVLIILISNLYLIYTYCHNLSLLSKVLNFIFFVVFEIVASNLVFKSENNKKEKKQKNQKEKIKNGNVIKETKSEVVINYVKSLIFVTIIWIFCNSARVILNLESLKQYRIINDNKVIVYSNNDYYITLDCDIMNNELIIYKGHQEKINNTNVYSISKKFDKVTIK